MRLFPAIVLIILLSGCRTFDFFEKKPQHPKEAFTDTKETHLSPVASKSILSERLIDVNFSVITPDIAQAGENFAIKIIAKDERDILISDYDTVGSGVEITTTGTGTIRPELVEASQFINGIATIDVIYDKTEDFTIKAKGQAAITEEIKEAVKVKDATLLSKEATEDNLAEFYEMGKRYYKIDDYSNAVKYFEVVINVDASYEDADKFLVRSRKEMVGKTIDADILEKRELQETVRKKAQ